MQNSKVLLAQCVMLLVITSVAQAQTPVTTNGGNSGNLPFFTGNATLGSTDITVSSPTHTQPVVFLRTPPSSQNNTVVDPRLLYEGISSGDGSAATPWGLNLSAIPWVWGQDAIYYHGGFHEFRTGGVGNTAETVTMDIYNGYVNVAGQLNVTGNMTFTSGSGASITFADGTIQSTAWNGVLTGGDYAESVNVSGDREKYEPGDVLVIDPTSEGKFLKSSAPYSTTVTGIYSTKPGVVGRRQLTARAHMKEEVPMAMTGIVPTKVSTENGSIKPGDLLVTSSKPGYAMKGTDRTQMLGTVIGKAIGHLDAGVGVIEAVVTLQ